MNVRHENRRRRLKYVAVINDDVLNEDTDDDYELQYIDIGNVNSAGSIQEPEIYRFEEAPSRARRKVRDGDVIISCVRTYLQAIAQIQNPPDNLVVSTGFAVVRPLREDLDTDFANYALREPSFLAEIQKRSVGVSYPAVNASDIADISIHLPLLPQQRAIADYLDRETARLDGLMAAKEWMLALLAEKRHALIAHTATCSLVHSGFLTVSGISIEGDGCGVEARGNGDHTSAAGGDRVSAGPDMQLRRAFWVMSGATPSSGNDEYWDGEILWITPEDLSERQSYWLADTRRKITDAGYEASGTTIAPIHSIALSKRAPIGQLAVLKKPACSNQGCLLLSPRIESDSRYFYYWLFCHTEHLQALGRGSTFMELSTDDLKSIRIPNIPLSQQCTIADYLDREMARLDALETKIRRAIALLKERRAALIAAAVTGQIDVERAA